MHTGQVAHAQRAGLVAAADHDQHLLALGQRGQERLGALGRRGLTLHQLGDGVDAAVARPVRERSAQRGGDHLLGRALAVVARLRAVHGATAGELRSARRTLTGTTGALLAVRLLAAAANLAARLRRVRALARRGALRLNDLMHQRDVRLDVEQLGGQLDRAVLLAARGVDVNLESFGSHLLFASLDCAADHDQSTGATGDGALDQQHAVLGIDLVHQQVLRRHSVVAHPARHARALEHPARGGAATDGAGTTVHRLRTVAGALAGKAVALHGAREALALAGAGHVDVGAVGEDLGGQLLADLVLAGGGLVVEPQFGEVAARVDARGGVLTGQRLVHLAGADLAVGQLHGGVAVALRGTDPGNDIGAGLDDGHRNNPVVLVEHLRHAQLGAQNAFSCHF